MSGTSEIEIYTEHWFDPNKKKAIDYALRSIDNKMGMYVEIGSFEGMSTVYIAKAIAPTPLFAVDTWQGGEFAPYEQMKYATTPIELHFDHNIAVATDGNVRKFKMDWREFFSEFEEPEISFVYVDGPHDYASVCDTIITLHPLMVDGGVMCGDDYDDPSVRNAVDNSFKFLGKEVENHSNSTWVVKF